MEYYLLTLGTDKDINLTLMYLRRVLGADCMRFDMKSGAPIFQFCMTSEEIGAFVDYLDSLYVDFSLQSLRIKREAERNAR